MERSFLTNIYRLHQLKFGKVKNVPFNDSVTDMTVFFHTFLKCPTVQIADFYLLFLFKILLES